MSIKKVLKNKTKHGFNTYGLISILYLEAFAKAITLSFMYYTNLIGEELLEYINAKQEICMLGFGKTYVRYDILLKCIKRCNHATYFSKKG